MLTGTIKDWNTARGFGFIKPDEGSKDIFVHCCALVDRSRDYLPIGTAVQFDVQADERNGKLRAIKVAQLDAGSTRRSPRDEAEQIFTHPGRL